MGDRLIEIVSICGSLRKRSYNRMVMNSLQSLAPDTMRIREAPSFREFPPYDWDIQQSNGFPAAVVALADSRGGRHNLRDTGIQLQHSWSVEKRYRLAITPRQAAVRRQADRATVRVYGAARWRARSIRSASLHGFSQRVYAQ
jgi:hypothetical protein